MLASLGYISGCELLGGWKPLAIVEANVDGCSDSWNGVVYITLLKHIGNIIFLFETPISFQSQSELGVKVGAQAS